MKWFFQLIIILTLFNCTSSSKSYIPDVSNIDINPTYHWTIEPLRALSNNNFNHLDTIISQHPVFYNLYINQLLGIRQQISSLDTNFTKTWSNFISDSSTTLLFFKIDSLYHDHAEIEGKITRALKFFNYHFPERQVPEVYFTNSSLSVAHFLFENTDRHESISIGLDFFLGTSFPYIELARNNSVFSQFMSRNFDKKHLVPRTMMAIVDDIVGPPNGIRMIDYMMHNGKKLYLLKSLMPLENLNILMGYSEEELKWCNDNKRDIWAYFIDEKLFYETTSKRITTYINPAPNSKGMPSESPGETANYIGYLIVSNYMKRHPDVNLEDLTKLNNAQEIMDQSKFKP